MHLLLNPYLHWQANNPPPRAMSRQDIEAQLSRLLPVYASRLSELLRPAIGLWPRQSIGQVPPLASRLGGLPLAPADWSWPMIGDVPMLFLGQVNCADIGGFAGAEALPRKGVLAFFGEEDVVIGSMEGGDDGGVFYWPEVAALQAVEPPVDGLTIFPECALVLRSLVDLPDPKSELIRSILGAGGDMAVYEGLHRAMRSHGIPAEADLFCGFSKLFGWPHLVQAFSAPDSEDASRLLLLQIDQYSNGERMEGWGPGGSLYYTLIEEDLREGRFEHAQLDG